MAIACVCYASKRRFSPPNRFDRRFLVFASPPHSATPGAILLVVFSWHVSIINYFDGREMNAFSCKHRYTNGSGRCSTNDFLVCRWRSTVRRWMGANSFVLFAISTAWHKLFIFFCYVCVTCLGIRFGAGARLCRDESTFLVYVWAVCTYHTYICIYLWTGCSTIYNVQYMKCPECYVFERAKI